MLVVPVALGLSLRALSDVGADPLSVRVDADGRLDRPRAVGHTTGAPRGAHHHDRSSHRHCSSSPPCPSACSTRAWAASPCCTSAWCTCPARTSPTSATRRASPTARRRSDELELYSRADHRLPRDRAGQAHRRGLLLGHLGRAAAAAGALQHADRRRGHAGGARRGADVALPPHRRARHARRRWRAAPTRAPSTASTRGPRSSQQACPGLVVVHRGGRRVQPGAGRRRARLHRAAQGAAPGRRHHGLHALPAHRAHAAAPPRTRRHAREPGRRDRPRGGGTSSQRQGLARPSDALGSYRFYTTGDVESVPLGRRPLPADAAHPRARGVARARSARSSRHDQPLPHPRGALRRAVRRAHPGARSQRPRLRAGAVPRVRGDSWRSPASTRRPCSG